MTEQDPFKSAHSANFRGGDDEVRAALGQLDQLMSDPDTLYHDWMQQPDKPLLISELPAGTATSKAFIDIVGQFDWPSNREDTMEKRAEIYEDEHEFVDNLPGEGAKGAKYLNNFSNYLRARPYMPDDSGQLPKGVAAIKQARSLEEFTYATTPVLYRTYAVMPEVMTNLFTVFDRYRSNELKDVLRSEEGNGAARAAHLAYVTMARLVKADDKERTRALFGIQLEPENITDAHRYLWS